MRSSSSRASLLAVGRIQAREQPLHLLTPSPFDAPLVTPKPPFCLLLSEMSLSPPHPWKGLVRFILSLPFPYVCPLQTPSLSFCRSLEGRGLTPFRVFKVFPRRFRMALFCLFCLLPFLVHC